MTKLDWYPTNILSSVTRQNDIFYYSTTELGCIMTRSLIRHLVLVILFFSTISFLSNSKILPAVATVLPMSALAGYHVLGRPRARAFSVCCLLDEVSERQPWCV